MSTCAVERLQAVEPCDFCVCTAFGSPRGQSRGDWRSCKFVVQCILDELMFAQRLVSAVLVMMVAERKIIVRMIHCDNGGDRDDANDAVEGDEQVS